MLFQCYFYAESTSQYVKISYMLIGNQVIWLVAPDLIIWCKYVMLGKPDP